MHLARDEFFLLHPLSLEGLPGPPHTARLGMLGISGEIQPLALESSRIHLASLKPESEMLSLIIIVSLILHISSQLGDILVIAAFLPSL